MSSHHVPDDLSAWMHDHVFDEGSQSAERGTRAVMWITAAMMVVEIAAGWWFNSMALLADGWHMSSHALAVGLSVAAYAAARRYARDPRFAFGTWKIEVLAGFTSAVLLLAIAVTMVVGSAERLLSPEPIHYQEAILVAIVGLAVNVVCALILGGAHHHHHDHSHGHDHDHHDHGHHDHEHHHDLNLKSAYVHVIADAATSVLAIVALFGGWMYGWAWLDPAMGIVGAVLVAAWAKNLIRDTGKILLDREMDHPVVEEIREAVESGTQEGNTRIADLHVWRVGKRHYSCALTVVTGDASLTSTKLRERIAVHEEVVHATIEIVHRPALQPAS
ncbi:CDF family Co(II)/Ni(II) efflux transporter DmeF [Noviherbaspirillum sp. UKPF54]|uniref:CDF family Co(II)/Ni(II) efflux transporter DmeF n=1 Tax=Noviherbaspirillum sp. UKPF54 TaxID=2601898 RepID=UPI0011B14C24|nr:CDF family Co(II)/Ni(II) efflux transporter DmeF [Noviherbaspirillum sp. UKPF54]QDZ27886.1 CDF family Co(II)/Ni(II) efflux transporter DmeF [Noviherbaspirillum sp. UKPF54]